VALDPLRVLAGPRCPPSTRSACWPGTTQPSPAC